MNRRHHNIDPHKAIAKLLLGMGDGDCPHCEHEKEERKETPERRERFAPPVQQKPVIVSVPVTQPIVGETTNFILALGVFFVFLMLLIQISKY